MDIKLQLGPQTSKTDRMQWLYLIFVCMSSPHSVVFGWTLDTNVYLRDFSVRELEPCCTHLMFTLSRNETSARNISIPGSTHSVPFGWNLRFFLIMSPDYVQSCKLFSKLSTSPKIRRRYKTTEAFIYRWVWPLEHWIFVGSFNSSQNARENNCYHCCTTWNASDWITELNKYKRDIEKQIIQQEFKTACFLSHEGGCLVTVVLHFKSSLYKKMLYFYLKKCRWDLTLSTWK